MQKNAFLGNIIIKHLGETDKPCLPHVSNLIVSNSSEKKNSFVLNFNFSIHVTLFNVIFFHFNVASKNSC